jgi:hypothetical protein
MSNSIPLSDLESSPSAKFTELGDTCKGTVRTIDHRQQTDMAGKPRTFDDGSPMMQYVIGIEQDDGEVLGVFAKGGKYQADEGSGQSMLGAIGAAVREAGASSVEVGGQLAVAFTGKAKLSGGREAKLYKASYRPPTPATASIPAADLFGDA